MNNLVFFGTGPVAAKSLEALSGSFDISLVVTKPKPKHHKYIAPVEEMVRKKGYKICFAGTTEEIDNQVDILKPASEIAIVIDFGVIISAKTMDYFRLGIINSHFSLLPRWRGADPITYSILNGDEQTGVSLMKIVERLDEGPLLIQKSLTMDKKINQITLTDELVKLSNAALIEYLPRYISGELVPKPQSVENISYSKKISKKDGNISWNKPARQLEREIRAYAGWPKSRATINKTDCIIIDGEVAKTEGKPGNITVKKDVLLVGCGVGSLLIKRLQPAGKKPMSAGEFIRGYFVLPSDFR
jgi:methionyl-tRNA formyltransferase